MPNERLPKMGDTLDPARVEAIAAMLPDAPFCFGKPATDREAWKAIGESSAFQKVFEDAEEGLEQDPQVISDELFLEFSQNGNRTHWQEANAARNRYLTPMVLAECIEHKGRFIHAIERLIDAICSERTWVMPAHDARLTNFHKTAVYIDLASSAMAWSLACVDYLLGDELTAATRERIRDEVQWRVFDPFREIQAGERDGNWWMTGTNNWNSVCLASVLGAALYLIEDKSERAWYVVASEGVCEILPRRFRRRRVLLGGCGILVLRVRAFHADGRGNLAGDGRASRPAHERSGAKGRALWRPYRGLRGHVAALRRLFRPPRVRRCSSCTG